MALKGGYLTGDHCGHNVRVIHYLLAEVMDYRSGIPQYPPSDQPELSFIWSLDADEHPR